MDILAAGILMASFRDAWSVVSQLGSDTQDWVNWIVAGAVVLAIDASILLLEQARSHVKLRGGNTRANDLWVAVLILISAMLNVRYLAASGSLVDRVIGGVLGAAIPSTIAVLGYIKGDMLAYNAKYRQRALGPAEDPWDSRNDENANPLGPPALPNEGASLPMFRLKR